MAEFTQEEVDKIKEFVQSGASTKTIAAALDRTVYSVNSKISRLGLGDVASNVRKQMVLELWLKKEPKTLIAEHTNLSIDVVRRIIRVAQKSEPLTYGEYGRKAHSPRKKRRRKKRKKLISLMI